MLRDRDRHAGLEPRRLLDGVAGGLQRGARRVHEARAARRLPGRRPRRAALQREPRQERRSAQPRLLVPVAHAPADERRRDLHRLPRLVDGAQPTGRGGVT